MRKKSAMDRVFGDIIQSAQFAEIVRRATDRDEFPEFVFSGVGKNWYVCEKVVKTFLSMGIRARSLDPSHALHGDMGMLMSGGRKMAFFLSKSGVTEELVKLVKVVNFLRKNSITEEMETVGFCLDAGNRAKVSGMYDVVLCPPDACDVFEFDDRNLVPSLSIDIMQLVLDAFGVVLFQLKPGLVEKYKYNHLAGSNGKKLGGDRTLSEIFA